MTKSKIFFYFCICFIIGIFFGSVIDDFSIPYFYISQALIVLILVFHRDKKIIIICFCLIFLILGTCYSQRAELRIKDYQLKASQYLDQNVILTGIIAQEPDIRSNHQKLLVKIDQGKDLAKVLVNAQRYPEYKYGDRLKIKGRLESPPVFEDFNYKDYLAKQGIFLIINYSEIEILSKGNYKNLFSLAYSRILNFKDKLRQSIYKNLDSPQNLILGAMILGDKNRIPQDLKEKLNIAGIRHITAVSGMHILILTSILMPFLIGLGFWRGQAFYFSIIFVFLFIVLTGLQSSAIRAGIMGGLFLLGQKIGRRSFSQRTIVLTAGLMLVFNPLLLMNNIGFQLSFLASLGIIYFKNILENWLKFIPGEIKSILAISFSAYIFTLPILIYNFGRISLIAGLTNILVLPIVPWIMILGFIFSLAGLLWGLLGLIFSSPVLFLLSYLLKIVDLFSLSYFSQTIENVHYIWLIFSYFILGFLSWYLRNQKKLRFLNY